MPFGGLLSIAGPLISGGGALAGLFGGSPSSNVNIPQTGSYSPGTLPPGFNIPQTYNMANQGGADTGAYGGIGGLSQYNVPGQLLGQYQSLAQQGVNNPYAGFYGNVAEDAARTGINSGYNAYNAGGALTSGAMGQMPGVGALMSLGFDPQNALYAKLQNQNQQQNAAILGQSGVAGTPYGAGVAADANSNFNINWQNQQLQRALSGAQGAGNLLGNISNVTGQGQGLQAGAAGQILQGGGMPYSTAQGITANQLGLLGQAGQFGLQGATLPQQQIQDYLSYLAQGTSQQGANTGVGQLGLGLGQLGVSQGQLGVNQGQLGLNQANQAFQQNQAFGNQFGQSLAGLGKAFGGGPSGIGGMPATGAGSPSNFASNMYAMSQGINPWG